jgi:hypothetical protein
VTGQLLPTLPVDTNVMLNFCQGEFGSCTARKGLFRRPKANWNGEKILEVVTLGTVPDARRLREVSRALLGD